MADVFVITALCLFFGLSNSADLKIPPRLKLGVASASYQIEGAWNASDKGESIWDRFTHTHPAAVKHNNNGDMACNSYNLWKRDMEMVEELGVDYYRFSLSWPRILPTAFADKISDEGVKYYNDIIDTLLEKGIEPVVTIYHWDLPQRLQDLGGWFNPLIADWFADYAKVVYQLFGDRVKRWITINEPSVHCDMTYNLGFMAPGIKEPEFSPFLCTKHVLLAHAKAWRLYDEEFKPKYNGIMSIANHLVWYMPYTDADEDLAELVREYVNGRFSNPIYSKDGGWPPAIERIMEEVSLNEGHTKSRLPAFTKEEKDLIRGTYDYYALNHYTSRMVRPKRAEDPVPEMFLNGVKELNAIAEVKHSWKLGTSEFFALYPKGLRKTLAWLKSKYGDIEMFISENGFSSLGNKLNDQNRIAFVRSYLRQVLLAIERDGINATGYSYWTLMDNFEWNDGYDTKFGLYEVDFTTSARTRTPRASAKFYGDVTRSRVLHVPEPPHPQVVCKTLLCRINAILFQ